jgi:hypothetical protein
MSTETKTNLVAWNGETYKGLGDLFDTITELAISDETELDLEHDETLRLAIWCWNNHETPTTENISKIIENEQDAYQGEADSVADFTENLLREVGDLDAVPNWVVIDFETTWKSALRFDFFEYQVIDIDGAYRQLFWRAY